MGKHRRNDPTQTPNGTRDAYGRKMIQIKNPKHPQNMRDEYGRKAKAAARKLSNKDLDGLLQTNIRDAEDLGEILTWTRGRKIAFIRCCAMDNFVRKWNKDHPAREKDGGEK